MSELTKLILETIEKIDYRAHGNLKVECEGNIYLVSGDLNVTEKHDYVSAIEKTISKFDPSALTYVYVNFVKPQLSVQEVTIDSSAVEWQKSPESILDEVETLFIGKMKTSNLETNEEYKRINFETFEKVKNIILVTKVITPIILDRNLKVIDGSLRLDVAKILKIDEIPVVVYDVDGKKADFIRLVLNRSSEFQRWKYNEVDELVDSLPQVQPLLEPIGFFSTNILPTSFFGNTMIEYMIDEYNDQQKKYTQDIGLAEWAKMRRAEIKAEEEARIERKKMNVASEGKVSLFDLEPTDDNFVEINDAQTAVKNHVEEMKDVAGVITDNYDAKRRAEKEAKGQVWQTSRRTSKKKAADKRAEAAAVLEKEVKGTDE